MMRKIIFTLAMLFMALTTNAADKDYCIRYSTTQAHANLWDDQASYTLSTPMIKGHKYTFAIKVMATENCTLGFWPIWTTSTNVNQWGNSNDVQYVASKDVTTEWKTLKLQFTADYDLDRLDLVFGGLNGSIFFDNVRLVESGIGVNMITNGEFTDPVTTGWSTQSGYNGTTFAIADAGNTVLEPGEPYVPDTWEYVEQGNPNFHIYLCFGQSNMEGNAQPEAQDYQNVPENFKMMAAVNFSNPKRTKGEWYTATPPLCRQGTGLTPADYFGRRLVEEYPDITVGVINVAVGGARIELFMDEYKDEYIAGEADWFRNYCAQYDNNPLGRLIEMGKKAQQVGTIKGILLHQGESNNGASDWCQKVGKIYRRICYNLGLDPSKTPLLAGETLYANMGGGCSWHNVAALPHLKEEVPNSYVISADGIPGNGKDAWHFSAEGYREFGKRYAEQMISILNTTAIENVTTDCPHCNGKIYNLQGQQVSAPTKGEIYIQGGKKLIWR